MISIIRYKHIQRRIEERVLIRNYRRDRLIDIGEAVKPGDQQHGAGEEKRGASDNNASTREHEKTPEEICMWDAASSCCVQHVLSSPINISV